MREKTVLTILFLLCFSVKLSSQILHHGFERNQDIPVYHSSSIPLNNAFGGGMNSVRFSEIDLNLDGLKDLIIFEKNGNRILPFLNQGAGLPYRYAPEYIPCFPKLHDWAILIDYNRDGKEDIFTYGLAGISIYKNISETRLQFELVTEQLQAYYYNGYTNLYASPDDYLAIADIDGDGDLDILNFWLLGKYVHYIKNWSMELYGDPETFEFRLEDECWGKFSEGADNNVITLHTDCNTSSIAISSSETRHIGSSLYLNDFSGDGLMDIVIGDVDYPNLILLTNGGRPDSAVMIRQQPDFPNPAMPVNLFSMPAVNLLDVNHDGIPDITVSPSDPSLIKSQNLNSVWLYEKDQLTGNYELTSTSFLQDDMIDVGSGAYPVLFDWNNDGLHDLFIGNYGIYDSSRYNFGILESFYSSAIAYYQNTGTSQNPVFTLITEDFGNLKQYNFQALYPAFGDFNGDGKTDLLCGNSKGSLVLFLNQSDNDQPVFTLPEAGYQDIRVGEFSTPQYFDIDRDGKKDLLIGNKRGHIAFYRNVSDNGIPEFELVTTTLGNVDVRDPEVSYFGFSVPCFYRTAQDKTILFCGNEQGIIHHFENIDDNIDGTFTLMPYPVYELRNDIRYGIREGTRIGLCVEDITNDNYPELIVGNWAGGIAYFSGIVHPEFTTAYPEYEAKPEIKFYPIPARDHIMLNIADIPIPEGSRVEIYDVTGRKILESPILNHNQHIDLRGMREGIYIGKTILGDHQYGHKIIVSP